MSENKRTVEAYMKAYARDDRAAVLDCLTDDVVWDLPGAFHLTGKAAFEGEMREHAVPGYPVIAVDRLTEENGVVAAEGTVRAKHSPEGPEVLLAYCDIFEMRGGKIARLISYLMPLKAPAAG